MDNKEEIYFKEFYSLEALSKELGITPRTLRRIITDGELKASNIGKSYVIQREDVKKWLNNNIGTIKRK